MKSTDRLSLHNILSAKVLTLLIIGIAGLQISFGQSSVDPSPSIVSWWTGDNNANDAIGTNAGVLVGGATYAPGKVGIAYSFNGTNAGVLVSNSPSLNFGAGEDISIETWIKARSTPIKSGLSIVDKRMTTNINEALGYGLNLANGCLNFQLATGPAWHNYWSYPDLRDDKWHHVAVSVKRNDPAGGMLYVDGQKIFGFDPTPFSSSLSNNAPLKIGYHADPNYDAYFSGQIDEVSIYRAALTSSEIANIYQAGSAGKITSQTPAPVPPGLAAWWKGESNVVDSIGGLSGWLTNGAGFAPGKVGLGLSLDGIDDRVVVPNSAAMNFGSNQDFSIETWIQAYPTPTNYLAYAVIMDKTEAPDANSAVGWKVVLQNGRLGFLMSQTPMSIGGFSYWPSDSPNLQDGNFHHVAVTVQRSSTIGGVMYVDGQVVATFNPTVESGSLSNSAPLHIGNHPNPNLNCFFKGVIDEASLYTRVLSSAEVAGIYRAGSAGKQAPSIYPKDGIPDAWRNQYFGATNIDNSIIAAIADPDGDGANNYQEVLAGTNPLDANSKPTNAVTLLAFNPAGGEFTNKVSVFLTTPVTNGIICFTSDNSEPTLYTSHYNSPVSFTNAVTLKARVFVNGYPISETVSAAYFLPTYALTLATTGTGTVTANPIKDRYVSGEIVQITATPGAGFGFANWSGAISGTTTTISLTMDGDKTLTANFKQLRNLTLAATGQGFITPNPNTANYLDGTAVQLTASADAGWQFVGWTGALASSQNPVSITMDAEKSVRATFKQLFTVVASSTGQGTVSLAPQQANYLDGAMISVTATAAAGQQFTGWGGDLSGTNNPSSLLVNSNKTITATFNPLWHLATTAGQGGSVTRDPDLLEYLDGVPVALTATAQSGFAFASWSGDVTGSNNPTIVTMNGSKTVQASFRDIVTPVITVTSPQPGATVNENFILSGTVTDNVGVASVRWEQNGQAKGALDLNNNQFAMSAVKLARGENRIRILAKDAAGNEGANEVVVTWNPLRTLAVIDPPAQEEGKTLVVPVVLISQGDVGGMSFVLRYDSNYLREADLTWSSAIGGSLNQVNLDVPGEVRASFALPATAVPAGTNLVANITFRARSVPAVMDTVLSLELLDASQSNGQLIVFGSDTQSGTARILQRRMKGDNNANDRLDIGDATLIQRLVTKLDSVRSWDVTLNDLNLSGVLDSGDVIMVLRVVVGLDSHPALQQSVSSVGGVAESREQGAGSMRIGSIQAAKPNQAAELVLLAPNIMTGKAGDLVTVQVVLTNLQSTIAGATFVLDYSTNALRLLNSQSLRVGAFVPGTVMAVWNVAPSQNDYLAQTGRVSLAVSSATAWAGTNGVLAELTFQVQSGASDQSQWPLRLSGMEITPDGYDNRQLLAATAYVSSSQVAVPPSWSGIMREPGTANFSVTLTGAVGMKYGIESSTNLVNWTPYVTLTNLSGTVQYTNSIDANYPQRFFRAKPAD